VHPLEVLFLLRFAVRRCFARLRVPLRVRFAPPRSITCGSPLWPREPSRRPEVGIGVIALFTGRGSSPTMESSLSSLISSSSELDSSDSVSGSVLIGRSPLLMMNVDGGLFPIIVT